MNVNPSNKNKKIWLGKLPSFLADKILENEDKTVIGEIIFSADKTNASININKEFIRDSKFPCEYNIKISQENSKMTVVTSSSSSARIEGVVEKEMFLMPKLTEKYLNYKRNIRNLEKEKIKEVEIIDYLKEGKRGEKIGSLRELEFLARKRKKMLSEKKRERLDKVEVMDLIFKAFEKYEFWTVKDLADFTGQPVAFIQEIVGEVCVLNKKDHRNSYELKPEYKM